MNYGTPRDISVEGINTDDYLIGVITDEKILGYDMQTLSQSEHKGKTQAINEAVSACSGGKYET